MLSSIVDCYMAIEVGYWLKFDIPQFLVDFAESWHTDRNLHADFKSVIKIPVS